jgi:glycosyltransferase involved in cell wall biosynthesis
MLARIIIVGSNSPHLHRYLNAIYHNVGEIIFITNTHSSVPLPYNIKVHIVSFRLLNLQTPFIIAQILKNYPNHVIHIHQANSYAYHTLLAVKLTRLKYKIILTAWGSDVLILPHKNILFKWLVKFNLQNSNIVTADAKYVVHKIKQLVPAIDAHYINLGLDNIGQQTAIYNKQNIILSNRLHKSLYNIDKIILAFAKLPTTYNYTLVIAGGGDDTSKLKKLVVDKQIANVVFVGMLNYKELVLWYLKAKIFISIPNSDATSQSLLEAMAYGCYPIVSNLPANREWINENNGIINYDATKLDQDLIKCITLNSTIKKTAIDYNYNLIKTTALITTNIKQFLHLYL